MYEMDYQALRQLRGVSDRPRRSVLDFMGKDELAGNLFRLALTEGRIRKESTRGQRPLERVVREVGRKVRKIMHEETGTYPEQLPTAQDIREVRKGLRRSGTKLGPLDDLDAGRQGEQMFLAEHMPEPNDDGVPLRISEFANLVPSEVGAAKHIACASSATSSGTSARSTSILSGVEPPILATHFSGREISQINTRSSIASAIGNPVER